MPNSIHVWQKRMSFHGALMLWIAMIYGLYLVGVMTDFLPGNEDMTLGAHINGLTYQITSDFENYTSISNLSDFGCKKCNAA